MRLSAAVLGAVLLLIAAPASAVSTASSPPQKVTSKDRGLTVSVPRGALRKNVKVRIHVGNRQHPYVGGEQRVECTLQGGHVVLETHNNAGNLTERMYACIGSSGAVHGHGRPLEPRQRFLEHPLDGLPLSLPLPPDEERAVIGDGDLEVRHSIQLQDCRIAGRRTVDGHATGREPGFVTASPCAHKAHLSGS